MPQPTRAALCVLAALVAGVEAAAARQAEETQAATQPATQPATQCAAVTADARTFQRHVTVLSSASMEGRVLGTRGLELALDYVEQQFRAAGLCAPHPSVDAGSPSKGRAEAGDPEAPDASYRQRFELGTKATVRGGHLAALGSEEAFAHGPDGDFVVTALGSAGEVRGPLVCVGYAIDRGPHGERDFSSFPSGLRLDGKVALALRFEPMDEDGRSRWDPAGTWSSRAQLDQKFSALKALGASAVLLVNPPGAYYSRGESLLDPRTSSRGSFDFPVLHLSRAAGERLVAALEPGGRSLMALRRLADVGPLAAELGRGVALRADLVKERLSAENVVGLLPGRGALAAEWLVIGAAVDHIGYGERGAMREPRAEGRELQPGADDNASGVAGLLVLAERLAQESRDAPADEARRSLVFVAFNGADAGSRGASHFVTEPPVPVAQLALMLNLQRLGRIDRGRLHLEGVNTGRGLAELLPPCLEASDLDVQQPQRFTLGSAHVPFFMARVPVLFAHGEPHGDLHSPRDTADKIDAARAVEALDLLHAVVRAAATHAVRFEFSAQSR